MEGPGMSLFKGAGSIHINNSAQTRLEEEHLADQKRRNEELNFELQNAFDDLIEEDDVSSINSSSNFPSATHSRLNHSTKPTENENIPKFDLDQNHCTSKCSSNIQDVGTKLADERHTAFHPHLADQLDNVYGPLSFRSHGMGDINNGPQRDAAFTYENPYLQGKREFNGGHCGVTNGHNYDSKIQLDYQNLLMFNKKVVADLKELQVAQKSAAGHLAIAKNEREQSELSLQQAQELLVESKRKVMQLEEEAKSYKQVKLELETRVEELSTELSAAEASLADCQHRLHTAKIHTQNNTDHLFKMQQERYKEEIERLHEDIEKARNRLAEKNKEVLEAERRAKESEKECNNILIDKGAIINRLAAELEQAHVQLNQAKQERNTARKQVKELGSKLESTALELSAAREERMMVESALDGTLAATNISSSIVTSTPTAAKDKVNFVKMELVKCLNCLRQKEDQLNKFSQAVKDKDQQIQQQQREFEQLSNEIDALRSSDTKHKNEMKILQHQLELFKSSSRTELLEGYKLKNEQLEEEIASLKKELKSIQLQHCEIEMELDKLKAEKSKRRSLEKDANSNLLTELDHLTSQLGESRKETEHFRSLYVEMCAAKEQMLGEMIKLRNSDFYMQLEQERDNVQDLKRNLAEEKENVAKLEGTILKLQGDKVKAATFTVGTLTTHPDRTDSPCQTDEIKKLLMNSEAQTDVTQNGNHHQRHYSPDIEEKTLTVENLVKELNSKNKMIEDLQIKIAFQMEKNKLVGELHMKAKQFEAYIIQHYMRLADKRDASTDVNFDAQKSNDKRHIATNTEECTNEVTKTKTDIRREIAEQFAIELKGLDTLYKNKLATLEQQNRDNFVQLKQMVENKATEVRTLQALIVSERKRTKELLTSKEGELSKILNEKYNLSSELKVIRSKTSEWEKYEEEVEFCKAKIGKLKKELEEKSKALLKEKEKVSKLQHEMQELQARKTERSGVMELSALKEKYKSAKRTAMNYKEYAKEKDRHVKNELDRIKGLYEAAVNRLQARLDAVISTKENQVTQRIYDMESDFEQKLAEFSNDIR